MFRDVETQEDSTPDQVEAYMNQSYEANRAYIDEIVFNVDSAFANGLDATVTQFAEMIAEYGKGRTYAVVYDGLLRPQDFVQDEANLVDPRAVSTYTCFMALMNEVIKLRAQLAAHHDDDGIVINPTDDFNGGYGASFKG